MEIPPILQTMAEARKINAPSLLERRGVMGLFALTLTLVVGVFFTAESYFTTASATERTQTAAPLPAVNPFAGITLEARAAYVLDIATGRALFTLNPDAQLPLASITKVPLAIAVSEVLSQDSLITTPHTSGSLESDGRLGAGEIWRVRDILDFTLVASSNGGAEILASAAEDAIRSRYPQAPAQYATIWRMNELARELNLSNTYFLNASGLDVSETEAGAYSSARDLAILFAYAARNWPHVFSETAKDNLLLTSINGNTTSALNTDQALSAIPGLIMGKTGYTDLAGGNLAIVFEVGPARPVVAVVLGSSYDGRFEDMKKLVAASLEAIAQ